jgi:hypothetical protein
MVENILIITVIHHRSMPGEYEHSSFQLWLLQLDPKHKMEIFQNCSNNSDYISTVYGDHFHKNLAQIVPSRK